MRGKQSFLRPILILVLCVAAVVLSGCLRSTTPAKPAAVKLPANFPDDFPIYPKTKVIGSEWSMNSNGRMIIRVKWQGPGRVAQALEFYTKELPGKGWDHRLKTDLQTKIIEFRRQNQNGAGPNHLAIAPVDESEAREGVFIDAEIIL